MMSGTQWVLFFFRINTTNLLHILTYISGRWFFSGFNIALQGHRDQDKHHLAWCFLNALCVLPAANDVWWGRPLRLAGGRSLGVSPGSGPGLMTEQSTRGIGLGKAFLDSCEWAYRLGAGNSFDCMLLRVPWLYWLSGTERSGTPCISTEF